MELGQEINSSAGDSTVKKFGIHSNWHWCLLVASITENFLSSNIYSTQAALYPTEAESRNVTPSEYGLVFGIYELVIFAVTPILGNYAHRIGLLNMYNFGIICSSTSVTAFAILQIVHEHLPFLLISYLLRGIEAIGATAINTSIFGILGTGFPDSIGSVVGLMEAVFGLSFAVGPVIGSFLYSIGGFPLPFLVTGPLVLLVGLSIDLIVYVGKRNGKFAPVPNEPTPMNKDAGSLTMKHLLKMPEQYAYSYCFFLSCANFGFLLPTLEPYLILQFQLEHTDIGLVFLLYGGVYAIAASVFGILSDKASPLASSFIVFGCVLIGAVGFLLIGPTAYLPLTPSLGLTLGSLVIIAVGLGGFLVIPLKLSIRTAQDYGFKNSGEVASITSALFLMSATLGGFVGATLAGVLTDRFGFRNAALIIVLLNGLLAIGFLIFLLVGRCWKRNESNTVTNTLLTQPLLPNVQGGSGSKDYGTLSESASVMLD